MPSLDHVAKRVPRPERRTPRSGRPGRPHDLRPVGKASPVARRCGRGAALLLAGLTGCAWSASPPPLPVAPTATVSLQLWAGSPLTGETPVAADHAWDGWSRFIVDVVPLSRRPETTLEPLAAHTRLLFAPGGRRDGALLAAARLLGGVRAAPGILEADDALPLQPATHGPRVGADAALPRGATAQFTCRATPGTPLDSRATPAAADGADMIGLTWSLAVQTREDGSIEVALQGEDPTVAEQPATESDDVEPTEETVKADGPDPLGLVVPARAGRETAILSDIDADGWTLMLPCPQPNAPDAVLWLTARRAPFADESAGVLAATRALALLAPRPTPRDTVALGLARLAAVVESLETPRQRRSLLVNLAERSGASLTYDVVLSIPDDLVDDLAHALDTQVESEGLPQDDAALGWLLERTTLRLLDALPEKHPAASACRAVIGLRTGALAYRRGLLSDLVDRAPDLVVFQQGVLDENRVLLDDRDPIGRVRAHAWLAARDEAPPGFDPLASRVERQALLAAWAEARAEAGAETETATGAATGADG